MKITKHAKDRLAERFDIKSDSEIAKLKRKFERDFIRHVGEKKTIVWKDKYVVGIFSKGNLVTVIDNGWTEIHFLNKNNPKLNEGKLRYRNRRKHEKTIYRRSNRAM